MPCDYIEKENITENPDKTDPHHMIKSSIAFLIQVEGLPPLHIDILTMIKHVHANDMLGRLQ